MKTKPRAYDTPAMRAALAAPENRDPAEFAPNAGDDFDIDEKEHVGQLQAIALRLLAKEELTTTENAVLESLTSGSGYGTIDGEVENEIDEI